jgi:hypothetical protein
VNWINGSDTSNTCYYLCGATTMAYYGIRRMGYYTYKCACLDRNVNQVAGGLDTSLPGAGDPATTFDCSSG